MRLQQFIIPIAICGFFFWTPNGWAQPQDYPDNEKTEEAIEEVSNEEVLTEGTSIDDTELNGITSQEPNDDSNGLTLAIKYDSGNSALSESARQQIKDFLAQSQGKGEIEQAYVAVWSDQEYPFQKSVTLTPAQEKLAKDRLAAIQDHMKVSYPAVPLKIFNMAVHSGFWSDLFDTKDASLKEALAGNKTKDVEPELQAIAKHAAPSVAVFSIKMSVASERSSAVNNQPEDKQPEKSEAE